MYYLFNIYMEYIYVVDEYSIYNFYLKMKEKIVYKMCDLFSYLKFLFVMEVFSMGIDVLNICWIKYFGFLLLLESKLMCYRKFIEYYLFLNYYFLIDLNLFIVYL